MGRYLESIAKRTYWTATGYKEKKRKRGTPEFSTVQLSQGLRFETLRNYLAQGPLVPRETLRELVLLSPSSPPMP